MQGPGFEVRRTIGNVEVKPGAVITHNPNVQLRFGVHTICQTVNPDTWIGRLTFNNRTVAETSTYGTYEQAARAAEAFLTDRIAALFSN